MLRTRFVRAAAAARISGRDPVGGTANYVIGNDPHTPAPSTALITTGEAADCGTADANGDGEVDPDDLPLTLSALFD